MQKLSIILVGCSLAAVLLVMAREWRASRADALVPPSGTLIVVSGNGNTLADLAARLNDPSRLRYDPQDRKAVATVSLLIKGELQLGRADDPDSGEILELDTQTCGDTRIEVEPAGSLKLYHSTIRTVSQVITNAACTMGYGLSVDGELIMEHSQISYMSGSVSECLRHQARASLKQSVFSYCDGSALTCVGVQGDRISIDGCTFRGSGNWGVVVRGTPGAPLELRNSLLDAQLGSLFIAGEDTRVRLVDCTFDRSKIRFNRDRGQVEVAWTGRFQVVDQNTRAPLTGVRVQAYPSGAPDSAPVETRTDAEGLAELVLTEYIARPRSAMTHSQTGPGVYRLVVRTEDARTLAEVPEFSVREKAVRPVVIPVSSPEGEVAYGPS
jgi:hypothetical protein